MKAHLISPHRSRFRELRTENGQRRTLPGFTLIEIVVVLTILAVLSLAIVVGGATAVAPERTSDIAAIAGTALILATLACFMTGAVAGLFYQGDSLLIQ